MASKDTKDKKPAAGAGTAEQPKPRVAKAHRKPERMEDVQEAFAAAVSENEAELGRASTLDERVAIMESLMERTITPSEVVKLAKRIRVMVHKSSEKDAVDPVPLSVNGFVITVKRGETVEIPEHFLEALEHAVESHFTFAQDKDDPSVLHKTEHEAPSYPFSTRGEAREQRLH